MPNQITNAINATGRILDAWLPLKIRYENIPGLSVGIVHGGKLLYTKGFGFADVKKRLKATPETNYRVASISKLFTATAIMQLVEQGKLRLDDPLQAFLPWFTGKNGNLDAKEVTIRDVLSHSSGIIRDGGTPQWITDDFPKNLEGSFSVKHLVVEPKKHFKYSNYGFALLGAVIEQASGISYDEYIRANIFTKAGIKNSSTDLAPATNKRLAQGYGRTIPDQPRELSPNIATNAFTPATGFTSNVADLAAFLSCFSWDAKQKTLLTRASRKTMLSGHVDTTEKEHVYGLGFIISQIDDHKVVGHGGGFAGFTTRIDYDPENDIGVVVLSNGQYVPIQRITGGIFETIYHSFNLKTNKLLSNAAAYEGTYRSRWNDECVVAYNGRLISFDPNTFSPLKDLTDLTPKEKHGFLMESEFGFDARDEVAQFTFEKGAKKATGLLWGSSPLERVQ